MAHPLLLHETLAHILSYLDGRSLIRSRLVCSTWNVAALSVFKEKVKIGAEILLKVPNGSNIIGKKELFASVTFGSKFPASNIVPEWAALLRILIRKYFCSDVNCLEVNCLMEDTKNVDSLVMALNLGFFPNLRSLLLQNLDISGVYNTAFVPESLASLQFLDLSVAGEEEEDPNFRDYCQKMVDAAPNLAHLNVDIPLLLDKLWRIKILGFRAREICNRSYCEHTLLRMLASTEDRIVTLYLKDVHLRYHSLPQMNSLMYLNLSDTLLEMTRLDQVFPSLQNLGHHCKDFSLDSNLAVKLYLESEPEGLDAFATELNDGWERSKHLHLVHRLPNLQSFVIFVRLTVTPNVETERKKLMTFLMNTHNRFLVVRILDDCRMSSLINAILVGVQLGGEHRKERTICFEFPAPEALRKEDPTLDIREDDKLLKKFGKAMKKLAETWDHIRLTGFRIPRKWIDRMHKDIKKWNLPVKLEFGIIPYESKRPLSDFIKFVILDSTHITEFK